MSTITTRVRFECLDHRRTPVPVQLTYTAFDPLVITLVFTTGPGQTVSWVIGRDLLTDAAGGRRAGLADVTAGPAPGRPWHVRLSLRTPTGQAQLDAPLTELRAFLDRTYAAVPAGREGEHLDTDRWLHTLLSQQDRT